MSYFVFNEFKLDVINLSLIHLYEYMNLYFLQEKSIVKTEKEAAAGEIVDCYYLNAYY